MQHIRNKRIFLITLIPIIALGALLFFLYPQLAQATHYPPNTPGYTDPYSGISGERVCDAGDAQDTNIAVPATSSGLYVPVRDFRTEQDVADIEEDTALIQEDTSAIRYYLRQLCYKEFSLDHTIQQAWADTISQFVARVQRWINSAYGPDIPIYVTNPHVYYRNVDIGVLDTLITEIEGLKAAGAVDEKSADIAIISLKRTRTDLLFDDLVEDWTVYEEGEEDKRIFRSRDEFTLQAWIRGTLHPTNNPIYFTQLARKELNLRRKVARSVEEQKLAWGRGFFPWEICGQDVFTGDPDDIRTCETLTPGSTIQDLTAIVLGTALRQMEEADEYEEWISGRAFWGMNAVFSSAGVRYNSTSITPEFSGGAISPVTAQEALIEFISEDAELFEALQNRNWIPKARSTIFFNEERLPEPPGYNI